MKQILKLKRIYILLLLPLSIALTVTAKHFPAFVEGFTYPYIYKPLSTLIGALVSLLPFSVSELLVLLLLCFLVWYVIKMRKNLKLLLVNTLCAASILVFLFQLCMGLNYYRYEAKTLLGLEIQKSSKQQLFELCNVLVKDINENRAKLDEDQNGVAVLSDKNRVETAKAAKDAYNTLSETYPFLKAYPIYNKPLVSSKLFSRFLTTGIYIPYTFESNINVDVPEFTIPATMCHELTHYRGFMRENEAEFLGYLAAMHSPRADFKYSASLMAFEYAFPKLYSEDTQLAAAVSKALDEKVLRDIAAKDEYWQKYIGKAAANISGAVYEGYLSANGQTSGLKSYGEMVDLLLAYYS